MAEENKNPENQNSEPAKTDQKAAPKAAPKAQTQKFFEEKAAEAKKGAEPVINLTDKVKVIFLQDVGFMKKGMKQEISQTAFDVYNQDEAVVKRIK